MKYTVRFSVKVKGSDELFGDMGLLPPGVVAEQEVEYEVTEDDLKSPMFAKAVMEQSSNFMDETVEVTIETVPPVDTVN